MSQTRREWSIGCSPTCLGEAMTFECSPRGCRQPDADSRPHSPILAPPSRVRCPGHGRWRPEPGGRCCRRLTAWSRSLPIRRRLNRRSRAVLDVTVRLHGTIVAASPASKELCRQGLGRAPDTIACSLGCYDAWSGCVPDRRPVRPLLLSLICIYRYCVLSSYVGEELLRRLSSPDRRDYLIRSRQHGTEFCGFIGSIGNSDYATHDSSASRTDPTPSAGNQAGWVLDNSRVVAGADRRRTTRRCPCPTNPGAATDALATTLDGRRRRA